MIPLAGARTLVVVVAALVGGLAVWAAPSESAAPPPLVGVVKSGSTWSLRPLDPRTLAPVRGSWSHRVTAATALLRSPRGTAVVASGRRTIFVDSRTGRELRRSAPGAVSPDLYWVGGERVVGRGRAAVFSVLYDYNYGSGDFWYDYFDLASGAVDREAFADSPPQAVTPHGMIVGIDDSLMLVRYADPTGRDFLKPKGEQQPELVDHARGIEMSP